MRRAGAATPRSAKTSLAAAHSVSTLRRASARIRAPCVIGTLFRIVPDDGSVWRGYPVHHHEETFIPYRTLGRTGIRDCPSDLATLIFGAMGNPDHTYTLRIPP